MSDQKGMRDTYGVSLMCAVLLLLKHEGGSLHVGSQAIQRRISKIVKAKHVTDPGQVFDAVSKVVQLAEELALSETAKKYKREIPLTDIADLMQKVAGSFVGNHTPIFQEFVIELMLEYDNGNFGIRHGEIAELNQQIVERTRVPELEVRAIMRKIRHAAFDRYETKEELERPEDDEARLMPRLAIVSSEPVPQPKETEGQEAAVVNLAAHQK